jgi:hypothetical protein
MQSADAANTVGSVLTRRFNQTGDIVKVGRGVWGLAEWYPGRSVKKKGAAKNCDVGDSAADEGTSGPPPEPNEQEPLS